MLFIKSFQDSDQLIPKSTPLLKIAKPNRSAHLKNYGKNTKI